MSLYMSTPDPKRTFSQPPYRTRTAGILVIGFDLRGAMDARELKRPGTKHPLAVTFLAAVGLVAGLHAQVGYA